MTTRTFKILLVYFSLINCALGQIVKEKTERLFHFNGKLVEKTTQFYNTKGQLLRSINLDYRNEASNTVTSYSYNNNGQLIQEIFSGTLSYHDSANTKPLTDDNMISNKYFIYDTLGRLKLTKEFNFKCGHDTCDIVEYFYYHKLLTKKLFTNTCSMKGPNSIYPVYYRYDKNDSLTLEQAWDPTDTTVIWYVRSFNYGHLPEKFIYERYSKKGDSLHLEERAVTKTEYLPDGRKSKTTFLEENALYDYFEYYKNNLLKSKTTVRNDKPIWKLIYYYNKQNNITRIITHEGYKGTTHKMKLSTYQVFDYKYF